MWCGAGVGANAIAFLIEVRRQANGTQEKQEQQNIRPSCGPGFALNQD